MGCGESKPGELEEEQREQLAPERQLTPEKQPVSKLDLDDGIAPDDAEDEEKAYAASKPKALTAADHKGITLLAALEERLVAVLTSGAIKWTGDAIARSGARSAAGLRT